MRVNDKEEFKRYQKILVYGIGNQFKELYKMLKGHKLYLFDGDCNKWGKEIFTYPIRRPEDIHEFLDCNSILMIGCVKYQFEIAKSLVEDWNVPAGQIYMFSSEWYEKNIYKKRVIEENMERIRFVAEHLGDDESREYYLNALRARYDRNPLLLTPNPNSVIAGEYRDILKLTVGEHIVDCGAYTGDTAEMYMKRLNGQCQIEAIEPFEDSFLLLKTRIEENNWGNKVNAYNVAVGNETEIQIINYDIDDFGMAISLLSEQRENQQEILVKKLDDLFLNQEITYLKMDIEGTEKSALLGARELIVRYHPKMMISAYHKIEDLWEIPETIWKIDSNYKIFVGHAPSVSTELEFYCI